MNPGSARWPMCPRFAARLPACRVIVSESSAQISIQHRACRICGPDHQITGRYVGGSACLGYACARRSSRRELIPGLVDTLPRCHSGVRAARDSWVPISVLVWPSRASRVPRRRDQRSADSGSCTNPRRGRPREAADSTSQVWDRRTAHRNNGLTLRHWPAGSNTRCLTLSSSGVRTAELVPSAQVRATQRVQSA